MKTLNKIYRMLEEFDRDMGIWADILGGIALVIFLFGLILTWGAMS